MKIRIRSGPLLGVAALFMPGQLIEVDGDAVLADG